MTKLPVLPRILGFAGLLPQLACALVVWLGPPDLRFWALAIGWGYAALILSFLGGLWWGLLAAQMAADGGTSDRPQPWMWIASVVPSLWALVTFLPWIVGANWPGPSLVGLGLALLGSVWVDRRLAARLTVVPDWWMALRVPLSVGLGTASIILALG